MSRFWRALFYVRRTFTLKIGAGILQSEPIPLRLRRPALFRGSENLVQMLWRILTVGAPARSSVGYRCGLEAAGRGIAKLVRLTCKLGAWPVLREHPGALDKTAKSAAYTGQPILHVEGHDVKLLLFDQSVPLHSAQASVEDGGGEARQATLDGAGSIGALLNKVKDHQGPLAPHNLRDALERIGLA
jgi:hypothetical protein